MDSKWWSELAYLMNYWKDNLQLGFKRAKIQIGLWGIGIEVVITMVVDTIFDQPYVIQIGITTIIVTIAFILTIPSPFTAMKAAS